MDESARKRLLIVAAVLLGMVQLAALALVLVHTHQSTTLQARSQLQLASDSIEHQLDDRQARLSAAVRRAAADSALKDALEGGDRRTMQRRLEALRKGEGLGSLVLISLRGDGIAATGERPLQELVPNFTALIESGGAGASVGTVTRLGKTAEQLLLAPIGDELPRAWLGAVARLDVGLPVLEGLKAAVWQLSAGRSPLLVSGEADLSPLASGSELPAFSRSGRIERLDRKLAAAGEPLVLSLAADRHAIAVFPYQLVATLVGLSLLAIGVGVGCTWYASRGSSGTLNALIETARRIAEGVEVEPIEAIGSGGFRRLSLALEKLRHRVVAREEESSQRTSRDALTGLPDGSGIDNHLRLAFERAALGGSVVAAMLIDASRTMKSKADLTSRQHAELLKELSRKLTSNVRVSDTLARTSEEQFLVVLEETDERLAPHLAEFLADTLSEPVTIDKLQINPKIHVGVVLYPQHCELPGELLRRADIALKEAIEAGRSVQVYEPGQDEEHLRQLAIISDMPNAIRDNDLFLLYQPKVSMTTGEVVQVEALVRWKHPQMGYLPPDEFIPLIEQSNGIGPLTDWVVKGAFAQARSWLDLDLPLGVAINLSANDLSDPGLPARVEFLLQHYLIDPATISFEVTESAVVRDVAKAIEALNQLRQNGIRISLDDFGTGHSSLALLKKLPIDELKIDKAFVLNLKPGTGDAVIVKSTVDLGHNLGLKVVAEGVESYASWRILKEYGCDMVQGHMISRALTPDELQTWYLELRRKTVNKLDYTFLESA